MAITMKNIYAGQLSDSLSAIISASGVKYGITSIELFNTSAVDTQTVILGVKKDSDPVRNILQVDLEPETRLQPEWRGVGLVLEDGMQLHASATDADTVNAVVSGSEDGGLIYAGSGEVEVAFESTYSLQFDGTDDHVICSDSSYYGFAVTDPFSCAVWVKAASSSNWYNVCSKWVAFYGWLIHLEQTTRKPYFAIRGSNGGERAKKANTGLTVGVWTHVCVTYDGSNTIDGLKIYMGGTEQATTTVSSSSVSGMSNSNPFSWAKALPDVYHTGNLVHGAIWNKELSSVEVSQVYNSGSPVDLRNLGSYPSCIGWWPLGNMGDEYPTCGNIAVSAAAATMTNMDFGDIVADVP